MKISCLQMRVEVGDVAGNMERAAALLAKTMQDKPDIVVLPELWDIGFFPRPLGEAADPEGSERRAFLAALAKKYQVNLVGGSIAVKRPDCIENRSFIFDREGKEIATYAKSHLFSPAKEEKFFKPGTEVVTFELDGIKCGEIICYDLRFPELIRKLALQGIQILFVPAEWPTARVDHWRTLLRARAIENQIFVAACNGSGSFGNGMPLAGHSVLLDPWGQPLAEADDSEMAITASLDFAEQEKIKNTINVFNDRRPELY